MGGVGFDGTGVARICLSLSLKKFLSFRIPSLKNYIILPMDLSESSLNSALLEFFRLEIPASPTDFYMVVPPVLEGRVSRYLEYFRFKELGVPFGRQVSQGLQIVAGALNAAFRFRRGRLMKR